MDYKTFLHGKAQFGADAGFEPVFMPDFLFDFQRKLVDWAVRKGRAAIFADCVAGETVVVTDKGACSIAALAARGKPEAGIGNYAAS